MDSGLVNILLVEDNPDDVRVIREALAGAENRKYHLECVNRVGKVRGSLMQRDAAAILLDLSLPDSQGLEALRWVRTAAKGRPIVVLSGTEDEELAKQAVREGAQDCLVKGVLTPKMLARCLDCAIERNRLHEKTSLLGMIVDSSDDAIIGKTLDGIIISWNGGAERMYGYSAQEAIGSSIGMLVPGGFAKDLDLIFEKLRRGERIEHYETVRVHKDGKSVYVSLSIFPILDCTGNPVGAATIARDFTKQKMAEAALRESEDLFGAFMDNTPAVAFMRDDQGAYVYVNRAFERMAGKPSTEIIGKIISDLWPDSIASPLADDDRQVVAENCAFEFAEKTTSPDGSEIDWLAIKFPFRDSAGRRFVGCVSIDVTQARRAEAALRRSEQRFRLITENIDEIFWIANPEVSEIVYVSPAYCRVWGRTQESLYKDPKSFVEACHPDDRERVLATFGLMKAGKPFDSEYRVIHTDGSIHWVWGRGFPIRDETGRLTLFAGIAQDVTARKHLEDQFRQAQKMAAVGRLAGGVAHDFNNLLTIINGYSEMALELLHSSDPLRNSLEQIKRAGDRAASLTRQLLAFSRQQVLAPRVLDLNSLVADVEKMLRRLIGEDIELTLVRGPALGQMKADPGQIEQILMNLAVNARDAMPEGGKLVIETANVRARRRLCPNTRCSHPRPLCDAGG